MAGFDGAGPGRHRAGGGPAGPRGRLVPHRAEVAGGAGRGGRALRGGQWRRGRARLHQGPRGHAHPLPRRRAGPGIRRQSRRRPRGRRLSQRLVRQAGRGPGGGAASGRPRRSQRERAAWRGELCRRRGDRGAGDPRGTQGMAPPQAAPPGGRGLPGPTHPGPERRDALAGPGGRGGSRGVPPRREDVGLPLGRRAATRRLRGAPGHAHRPHRRGLGRRRPRGRGDALPRRPLGGSASAGPSRHAPRSRCPARRRLRPRDRIPAGRGRVGLPPLGGGLPRLVLRARGLRPVPALHHGHGQPGSGAARGGGRVRPGQGPPGPGRGRGLHVPAWLLRPRAHRRGLADGPPGRVPGRRRGASLGETLSAARGAGRPLRGPLAAVEAAP